MSTIFCKIIDIRRECRTEARAARRHARPTPAERPWSVPAGARILQIDGDGEIERVGYDDAEPVTLTRGFLASPDRFLRHLLTDE
jgi:hypothetical protein